MRSRGLQRDNPRAVKVCEDVAREVAREAASSCIIISDGRAPLGPEGAFFGALSAASWRTRTAVACRGRKHHNAAEQAFERAISAHARARLQ